MTFNERKVTQMAAFFLQERGGQMAILKLMKLLYLAERESLRLHGIPMSGDKLVAMPHGPVLSMTYDLMSGSFESHKGGWQEWICDQKDYEVSLDQRVSREDLDELSDADMDILQSIWNNFGTWGRWKIRDYTHEHCPEWEDPEDSSFPISYEKIFLAFGCSEKDAQLLSERIEDQKAVDRLFRSL